MLFYAPMFHLHMADHDGTADFHAHFPEPAHGETTENGSAFETEYGHTAVYQIDIFTSTTPVVSAGLIAEPLASFRMESPDTRIGFVSIDTPRSHDPPAQHSAIPRSPPV